MLFVSFLLFTDAATPLKNFGLQIVAHFCKIFRGDYTQATRVFQFRCLYELLHRSEHQNSLLFLEVPDLQNDGVPGFFALGMWRGLGYKSLRA